MKPYCWIFAFALTLSSAIAGASFDQALSKRAFPEDLGPSEIDVSSYPPEHQKTYRAVFVPVFRFLGGTARTVNSPIIELDPRMQESERKAHPELFSDPALAQVSQDGWKRKVEEIRRRPPCCGACPVLSMQDAKALWRFLVYDSIVRKTGPNAKSWIIRRQELLTRFKNEHERVIASHN